MNALRHSSTTARLVLAWFLLVIGAAAASPLIHPLTTEIICTVTGPKVIVIDEAGQAAELGHHSLDCSLCLAVTLPPALAVPLVPSVWPLAHALEPRVAAHIAALVGAPMPPRGPPSLA